MGRDLMYQGMTLREELHAWKKHWHAGVFRDKVVVVRQVLVCLVLLSIPLFHFYMPPFFILGFFLFFWDGFLGGFREWRFRDFWPLLFPLLFWLLTLIGVSWSVDVEEGWRQVQLRALFALGPFLICGLHPRRVWGDSVVCGTILLCFCLLIGAVYISIKTGSIYITDIDADSSKHVRLALSRFSYYGLSSVLGEFSFGKRLFTWPNALAFHVFVSIGWIVHGLVRCIKMGKTWWIHGLVLVFLFFMFLLSNSRTVLLGLLLSGGYVLFELFFFHRGIRWYYKLGFLLLGAVILGGVSMTRLNFRGRVSDESLESFLHRSPRMRCWRHAWDARESYLPWGLGTGGSNWLAHSFWEKDEILHYDGMLKMHNGYYDVLIEWGIWGFLLFVFILFWPLYYWRFLPLWGKYFWIGYWVLLFFDSLVEDSRFVPFLVVYYAILSVSTLDFRAFSLNLERASSDG